ncbi:uncharacterized protein Z519_10053 [Cladophialophora bantiana CBS 173.52]|uniref:RBR-type E3 ubiquitin transferase n=1 Tax=Cladophialophora bantiana (strain ATCC 10958 / CBS 173.52 / CDC B-1940 / NIH 8579) TaxID=1442370 RepID=A0A0D2EGL7_CLAB1|nr:uncharacterized protein Z519_10053 [Cladophialophora bantiana CBS 173.52]KIW89201.1 hypothetical protein Z519_10053 [Cladophialophora bantiana CBS 173.52]
MLQKTAEASGKKEYTRKDIWEAFKDVKSNPQPSSAWTRQNIPSELQSVEDDSDLPEKLKQILVWSLSVHSPPSQSNARPSIQPPGGPSVQDSRQAHEDSKFHQTNAESACRSVASEKFDNDDTSESRSTQSERRLEKSRLRPRYIGGSVLGSTISLITAFKNKSEKESSQPHIDAKKAPSKKAPQVECTSCFEDIPENATSKLPCNHSYCKPCLTTLITTALQTESSFPPKCCLTEIPLQTVLLSLDSKQREIYKEKAAEYAIAPQERWYCPNTKCLKWIPPSKLQRIRILNLKCPHCATKICSVCRGLAHRDSADCPQDYGLEATIMLAELEGWRRCFKCRTMVERTQGCRHMTCKCGAQFCYSCGAKWRSCSCTETDEANRQAELRRRRGDRAIAVNAEVAEIDRVIAQVEEMERREAEERRREEQRREADQRREEAELARLEELRLREEEARRLEEERMTQELRRILQLSVEETCDAIQSAWDDLLQSQRKRLDDRHLQAEQQHAQERDEATKRQQQENGENFAKMESNLGKRTSTIKERHNKELEAFNTEQQDLEDDLFLEIQLHLRGKQDKQSRERRLQERFQRQRDEKQRKMLSKHRSESESLQANATMELQGLKLSNESKLARLEHRYRVDFEILLANVVADRAWFDFLAEKRQNMVDANRRLMLAALEADQEPVGLTEETATTIGPFLTSMRCEAHGTESAPHLSGAVLQEPVQEPWREVLSPSPAHSASPARSLVELAATSQQLLNSLNESHIVAESDVKSSQPGAVVQPMSNRAFAWMTGGAEDVATSRIHHDVTARHSPPAGGSQGFPSQTYAHAAPLRFAATSNPTEMMMSGGLRPTGHSVAPSMDRLGVPSLIPPPLQTGRRQLQRTTDGLKGPERYANDPPPPVPKVPAIYLARQRDTETEIEHSPYTMQQPRGLGGLVPIEANRDNRHGGASHGGEHKRQSSSSGSLTSSSSLLTPSITTTSISTTPRSSPSATRTSSSRSSGESLFLHSLITATTNAATAAGRPSRTSLSPVSPISPAVPVDVAKQKSGGPGSPQMRPTRSVWSILG